MTPPLKIEEYLRAFPEISETLGWLCRELEDTADNRLKRDLHDDATGKATMRARHDTYQAVISLIETLIPENRQEIFNATRN